jgi:hypothetical protein
MKCGNLNFLEHSGPLQACNGTALPYLSQAVVFIQSKTNLRCICFYLLYLPKLLLHKPMYLKCSIPWQIPTEILFKFLKTYANYKRRQSHHRRLNDINIIWWIIETQISSLYWSNHEPYSTGFFTDPFPWAVNVCGGEKYKIPSHYVIFIYSWLGVMWDINTWEHFLHLDKILTLFVLFLLMCKAFGFTSHTQRMKTRVQCNLQWNWQLNADLILIGIEWYFKFYVYSYFITSDL